jgi:pyruvate/2-oxoacid:ferredoxin oxidoreductase alpha subunit
MAKVKAMPDEELADTSRSAIEVLAELDSAQELVIEREQDRLYAYDKATRAFVAQGSTIEQVFEQARSRFPNIKFFGTISQDNSTKELV